jgi:hypothetical protein
MANMRAFDACQHQRIALVAPLGGLEVDHPRAADQRKQNR